MLDQPARERYFEDGFLTASGYSCANLIGVKIITCLPRAPRGRLVRWASMICS